MFRYIEKLQNKPEHIRQIVLLVSVVVIMIIIITIWLSTFSIRISKDTKKQTDNSSELSPFSMIKNDVMNFYKNIKKNIPGS